MTMNATASATISLAQPPEQLRHPWRFTVGSGHALLALRADWQAQLRLVRAELGFQRVRFHGIFADDLGTLVLVGGKPLDSFHNLDVLVDAIVAAGMGMFVEFSFMPTALASGSKTVFNYHANVTPPKDPDSWAALISRVTRHWLDRYGFDELRRWRFEVWNEPNMASFWNGTQQQYFEFYRRTALALKQVDHRLLVGGPATAKNAWLDEFIATCTASGAPLDFVSTHHYPTDAFGNQSSDIVDQLARSARDVLHEEAARSRAAVGGLPLYYTEWSITSSPHDLQHDQSITAAYVIHAIMGVRGLVDGYSYWTFSDIFAENYYPSVPFHGGFGLLSLHGIRKPAYQAMRMLAQLGDDLWPVPAFHPMIEAWLTRKGSVLTLLVVHLVLPGHRGATTSVDFRIDQVAEPVSVLWERIDEEHANPYRRWLDMGSPEHLMPSQLESLHAASALTPAALPYAYGDHALTFTLSMPPNAVAAVRIELPGPSLLSSPISRERQLSQGKDPELLDSLQRQAFSYFLFTAHEETGLMPDSNKPGAPASIGALGFALASYPVAVERGFMTRAQAVTRANQALQLLVTAEQGPGPEASGYRGFFYHFLDPRSGRRVEDCELSTIDTALFIGGALVAAAYFAGEELAEAKLRQAVDELYRRVEWNWAVAGDQLFYQGWKPSGGFLPGRCRGYNEGLLLYVLAAGSPTHATDAHCYQAYTASYEWRSFDGLDYLYAGPLFIHQYPHCFIDLRGIRDAFMRAHDCDYAENSRRATHVQQRYAIQQKDRFAGYGPLCWGITASDGPGQTELQIGGRTQEFFGYRARGVPEGPDDGTIAPWATLASLPFAPEIVLPTIRHVLSLDLQRHSRHGFRSTFNLTYPQAGGWVAPWHLGINQGPAVVLVENHRTALLWRLMQRQPALRQGLIRCGFTGAYLEQP